MQKLFQDLRVGMKFRFRIHPNGLTFLFRDDLDAHLLEIHDVVGSDIIANVAAVREIARFLDLVIAGTVGLCLQFAAAEDEDGAVLFGLTRFIRERVLIPWDPPRAAFDLVYLVEMTRRSVDP